MENTQQNQDPLNPQKVDRILEKDEDPKTAADFEKTVQQAESETETRKPGESLGNPDGRHHTGRGGGNS